MGMDETLNDKGCKYWKRQSADTPEQVVPSEHKMVIGEQGHGECVHVPEQMGCRMVNGHRKDGNHLQRATRKNSIVHIAKALQMYT